MSNLQTIIDAAWDDRANLGLETKGEIRDAVDSALAMLDAGTARVAEPVGDGGANAPTQRPAELLDVDEGVALGIELRAARAAPCSAAPAPAWSSTRRAAS